jgi:acyl-CoA synthetase (AMP-forming)/AMP-acid ligase II
MIRSAGCDTLRDLYLRSCRWRGGEALFVDERERLSGAEALEASLRFAGALARRGVVKGDVVAYLCRSSARHASAWFASPLMGAVACNLHVRETPQRLVDTLAWLDARVLVYDEDLGPLAEAVLAGGNRQGVRLGERSEPFNLSHASPAPGDLAAILLSSGSTGRPKGVMHTQHTLLETAKGGQHTFGPITPHDSTVLVMQPSFAAWVIIVLPFVGGKAKVCFGGQFTPAAFLEWIERERITFAPLVPTMWRMVFGEDLGQRDLSSLALVAISGEPPAPSDIERLHASVCRRIVSPYFSSEACTATGVLAWTGDLLRPGKAASSGKPGVGVDLKILDPAGGFDDELAPGEAGEIALSGPSLAPGYWKDEVITRERFRDGWWRSGDLGRVDEDGDLWILGRLDNLINTGGIKVSGEEIERVLLGHPALAQCAVIGRADERFGQRIEAFAVLRQNVSAEELERYCRQHLAGFKVPRAFHFVGELPTGPTGKLYRRALRGDAQAAS